MKYAMFLPTTLLILLSHSSVAKGVSNDLSSFFDGLQYQGNITAPQSYQGQMADYYTGGSAYIRTPVNTAQIASFTVPEINAGCGGIDLFAGGFSYINSDQLVAMGKSIVSNAIPFAVDLALQTWAPQLKNVKDRLEAIARQINALSVNSCETAQASVSALAGFAGIGNKQYICSTMGTQNNMFADWAAAKNGCNNQSEVNKQLQNASNNNGLKEHIPVKRNIIWYSLMKNPLLQHDEQTAEFFMSLSGTIVYNNNGDVTRYPSLLTSNNNLISVLSKGGSVDVYQCDRKGLTECLNPIRRTITFTAQETLKSKVTRLLTNIITKYRGDNELTKEEKGFIDSISLPVLKMMTVNLEAGYGLESTVNDYANVIATDLVTAYLQDALLLISSALDSKGSDQQDVNTLYDIIGQANEQMRLTRIQALQSLQAQQAIIQSAMTLEQRVEGQFSAQTRASLLFDKEN